MWAGRDVPKSVVGSTELCRLERSYSTYSFVRFCLTGTPKRSDLRVEETYQSDKTCRRSDDRAFLGSSQRGGCIDAEQFGAKYVLEHRAGHRYTAIPAVTFKPSTPQISQNCGVFHDVLRCTLFRVIIVLD
jgi:hypothetical protein